MEGEICADHINISVTIPPKMSVLGFMRYLKGKSTTIIFQKWGNMKFAYRNCEFGCKDYCCSYDNFSLRKKLFSQKAIFFVGIIL